MNKQIYIIFYDRGYRAQDNAEHLCRWVMKNHPEIKTGYILNNTSPDWKRLENEGFRLLNALDRAFIHNELLACDYACSSIFNEGINLNFSGCTCKRVFLNHGCFLVPINYIKAEHNNIDLFIAANKIEYDTMLDPYHELSKEQVALCGQPRQDELIKLQKLPHKEDSILIQFWQRPGEWCKDKNKQFINSTFYKKTSELLTNSRLLKLCRNNKLKIIFKMHSIQYDWLKYYAKYENDVIKLSPLSEPFEPKFIESKFIITDISSNAYEMAKIGKPCIYFEPDPDELFKWRWTKNGGHEFNLDKHSIGPVIYSSVDKLIDEIEALIDYNYYLVEPYRTRYRQQISFVNDSNSCERCFKAILSIKGSKTAERTRQEQQNKKTSTPGYGRKSCYLYF